jgi:hypothetical protein
MARCQVLVLCHVIGADTSRQRGGQPPRALFAAGANRRAYAASRIIVVSPVKGTRSWKSRFT